MTRRRRGGAQPRYVHTRRCHRVRVLTRFGDRSVTYRGRLPAFLLGAVLTVAGATTCLVFAGATVAGSALGGVLLLWAAGTLRLSLAMPAGPPGPGGGPSAGGAGVREPRRPLPTTPGGAAARPFTEGAPVATVALR